MRIIVGDYYSKIVSQDLRVRKAVDSVCRARPDGYRFMPRYKSGRWDGYVTLRDGNNIPTGLLGTIVTELKSRGYNPQVDWSQVVRKYGSVESDCLHGVTLRDYQVNAVNTLLAAGRGIAKMATNAGKTEIIAAMANVYGSGLVIVNSVDLLWQGHGRLARRLPDSVIGYIGDGERVIQPITIATIQTLASMRQTELQGIFKNNTSIFLDECHHGSAATYMKVLQHIPGFHRFGFSGTPLNRSVLNDLQLIGNTGRVLVEVSNEELIDAGYSAKPIVHIHVVDGDCGGANYHEQYDVGIVHNDARNRLIRDISMTATGVVLVIVSRIDHGRLLCDLLPGSVFVCGDDSSDLRSDVLEKMRTMPGVYIATNIFDEGVDVPALDAIVMAAGGKSQRAVLQRIGRGLRVKPDGGVLNVHDFIDPGKFLLKHSEARIDIYLEEGFEVNVISTDQ